MTTFEQRARWLVEITGEQPVTFADYFREDIADYLSLESGNFDDLSQMIGVRMTEFERCTSKDDVRDFVSSLTGAIVLRLEIDEIVTSLF